VTTPRSSAIEEPAEGVNKEEAEKTNMAKGERLGQSPQKANTVV
jgi:hypothetical protein